MLAGMWTLFLACTGPGDSSARNDTGVGDTGTEPDASWHCPQDTPSVTPGSETDWLVTTAHYSLEVDGPESLAMELGLLSEGAWLAYGDWFGTEPAQIPLRAGFYADLTGFQAAMVRDGASPASSAGYYDWGSATAYTQDQPTHYYDHVLFLHELAHQWHHLAAQPDGNQATWYSEGLAEVLSRHDWDGECLRVARLPVISQEDFSAEALRIVDANGNDVDTWLSQDIWPGERPIWFAVTRWLMALDPEAFEDFRLAYDADSSVTVSSYFGTLDGDAFEAWLRGEQEPLTPVWIEWTHRNSDSVRGFAEYSSVARVKVPGDNFSTTLRVPNERFMAGLLLGWDSAQEHTVLYVDESGGLTLGETLGGSLTFWDAGAISAPSDSLPMSLSWDQGQPVVELGGDQVRPVLQHAPGAGLAIYGADVVFDEMAW